MYKVIGHPKTRTMRVIWTLEELGLPYDLDPVSPASPEARAINPTGKVPVLITEEGPVTDSVAIVTYLADKHGALTYPAGSIGRARQDSLMQFVVSEVDAALWTLSKHRFVLPKEERVDAVLSTARAEYARALAALGREKGDAPFLAGDRFTIADIVLSHCVGWGISRKLPAPDGAFGDYLKSLRKRPAMQRLSEAVDADR